MPSERVSAIEGREWDLLLDGLVQGRLIPEVSDYTSFGPGTHDWIFWHITWNDGSTNYPGDEDYDELTSIDEVNSGYYETTVRRACGREGRQRRPRTALELIRFEVREVPDEQHHGPVDHDAQARALRRAPWEPDTGR